MEDKAKFSDRDWSFLVQLPYRVGLWMAHQDARGGQRAYTREMTALSEAIKTCRQKYANIPLASAIIADTMMSNPAEDQWVNALADCTAALTLMKPHCDGPALNCIKLMLIDIAESVARAAPNDDLKLHNLYNGPQSGWYAKLATPLRYNRGPKVTKPEKHAINQLIVALDASAIVQEWDLHPFASQA